MVYEEQVAVLLTLVQTVSSKAESIDPLLRIHHLPSVVLLFDL